MTEKNGSFNTLAMAKICRLCETKDGPFLNIFGPDMDIAKKIENVVFITISEYDDLPHKVCFRCSARLEDFQEFIYKCIKAQENLSKLIGVKFSQKNPMTRKIKFSWEAKLNENKISNEEYCDELIKKALELAGVKPEEKSVFEKYNVKQSEVRLAKVDKPNFPGIDNKNGKYRIVDISKIPKKLSIKKKKPVIKKNESESVQLKSEPVPSPIKNVDPKPTSKNDKDVVAPDEAVKEKSLGKSIPDNFVCVKVAGVGAVYTCKVCDSLVLDAKKLHNHKCVNVRSPKANTNSVTAPSPGRQTRNSTDSNTCVEPVKQYKPGPARHKAAILRKTEIQTPKEKPVTNQPTQNNVLNMFQKPTTPLTGLPTGTPIGLPAMPTNIQISNINPGNIGANQPNNFYGFQFPTNFYLVPSGDNTFALQAGPPLPVQSPTQIQLPKPLAITPAVPAVSAVSTPKENSILPDLSNSIPHRNENVTAVVIEPKGRRGRKAKNKPEEPPPPPEPVKIVPPKPVVESPKKPSAPYPIGLLCRNSSGGTETNKIPATSKSQEYPHYTILPPKTPGKIVISTVPQKKSNTDTQSNKEDAIPLKKRRKQTFNEQKVEHAPPVQSGTEHFFTYVNLDTMLAPESVLPISSVQESSVSTTVTPDKPVLNISKKKNNPPPVVENKEQAYVCSICDLPFSREKKLIAHVKKHYASQDDDD